MKNNSSTCTFQLRNYLVRAAVLVGIALPLAACGNQSALLGGKSDNQYKTQEEWRSAAETLGKRYESNPGNQSVAMSYARALRATDQKPQAVAVLQQVAIKSPKNKAVLAAYGKALLDVGRAQEAAKVLSLAHTPDKPDWRILTAQGTAADQLGDSTAAQQYYEAALKLAPEEPMILANLGLSYALEKRLKEAETVLREAAASPRADHRVRQNLAFVLNLNGKTSEANAILKQDTDIN